MGDILVIKAEHDIGAAVVVQRDHNLDRPFGDLVFAWVAQKGAW
jgi:hypothetical protein